VLSGFISTFDWCQPDMVYRLRPWGQPSPTTPAATPQRPTGIVKYTSTPALPPASTHDAQSSLVLSPETTLVSVFSSLLLLLQSLSCIRWLLLLTVLDPAHVSSFVILCAASIDTNSLANNADLHAQYGSGYAYSCATYPATIF
jgi:hypothetical protein